MLKMLRALWSKPAAATAAAPAGAPFAAAPPHAGRDALAQAIAALSGADPIAARDDLARLAQAHLGTPIAACAEGWVALSRGDTAEAAEQFEAVLAAHPDFVEALAGQARACLALGRDEECDDNLELALAFDPDCIEALLALGRRRAGQGDRAGAVAALSRAGALAPGRGDVLFALGRAHAAAGEWGAADRVYAAAAAAAPRDAGALVNRGLVRLQHLVDPATAEALFRAALARDPTSVAARANLGLALQDQGRVDEAVATWDAGLVLDPRAAEFRWNVALARLQAGDWAAGWDDYELRFDRPGGIGRRRFPFPEWDGAPLAGRGILIYAEQGLGDEIMFASCIPDLVAMGARVVLECSPRLEALFRRAFPQAHVHGAERGADRAWLAACADVDCQSTIGSLPRVLRRAVEDFPVRQAYLAADPDAVRRERDALAAAGPGPWIGFTWRGGTATTRHALRSIPLDRLEPLLAREGRRLVSLQHGLDERELGVLRAHGVRIADASGDLDALAAQAAALDGIVAVQGTVAHLAGALGLPATVLLAASPEWRWPRPGGSCRWYPSLRFAWQPVLGDWEPLLEDVARRVAGAQEGSR